MPGTNGDDGQQLGADDSADVKKKSGTNDGDGAGNPGGNDNKDDKGDKSEQVVFDSQEDLDRTIKKRVDRALKDQKAKSELTETQRLERERDDAKAEVAERDLRDSFIDEAGIDATKARRYFRMYREDIEIDEKGKPTNLKDVIATFKKEFPAEFGKQPNVKGKGDGAAGNGGDGKAAGGDMNSALRQMAGKGKAF